VALPAQGRAGTARVFGDDFRGYEEADDIREVLDLARPYLVPEGTLGEMLLSVAKTVYLHRKGADGVLDINPFSCMNGIVSEAIYPRLSRDCDGLPVRVFYFDGRGPTGGTSSTSSWTSSGNIRPGNGPPGRFRPDWGGPWPSPLERRHPLGHHANFAPSRRLRRISPSAGRTGSTTSGISPGTTPAGRVRRWAMANTAAGVSGNHDARRIVVPEQIFAAGDEIRERVHFLRSFPSSYQDRPISWPPRICATA